MTKPLQGNVWERAVHGLWLGPADRHQYSVVQIGLAVVSLIQLVVLWEYRHMLYSEAGFVDQQVVIEFSRVPYFSLFELIESPSAVTGYFIFSGVCMVLLGLGIFPRVAAFLIYLFFLSYINRSPLSAIAVDNVLHVFSFLVLISPIGHRIWPGKKTPFTAELPRYGITLMRLQVFIIYVQAVINRAGDPYWLKGEFLTYFLLGQHSRFEPDLVLQMDPLLTVLTWLTPLVEIAIPVLLWIRKTRWYGVALGLALHLGVIIMAHGFILFLVVMAMGWLAFLRPEDLNRLPLRNTIRP